MADIKNGGLVTGLESYWGMDEASGDRVDSHGSNTLIDNNTVGSATGKLNSAAFFIEANSEHFSVADNPSLSNWGNHSLSFWFKATASGNDNCVISKWSTGGRGPLIRINSANKFQHVYYSSNSGGNNTQHTSTSAIADVTIWHHYVVTCNVVSKTAIMYIDGASVAVTQDNASAGNTYDNSAEFNIGGFWNGNYEKISGTLDEVGFWKGRVLSASDVTELYNSGTPLPYEDTGGGTPTTSGFFNMMN